MRGGLHRPRPGLTPVDPASGERPPQPRRGLPPGVTWEEAQRRTWEQRDARARAQGRKPLRDRMSNTPPPGEEDG